MVFTHVPLSGIGKFKPDVSERIGLATDLKKVQNMGMI